MQSGNRVQGADTDALRDFLEEGASGLKAGSDLVTKVRRAKDLPDDHVADILTHFHSPARAGHIARPEYPPHQCSPRLVSLLFGAINGGTFEVGPVAIPASHTVFLKTFADRSLYDIGKGGPLHLCAAGDATPLPNVVHTVLSYMDAHEAVALRSLMPASGDGVAVRPLSGGFLYKSFRTSLVSLLMKLTEPAQARLVGQLLQDRACSILNELSEPVDFDTLLWPKMDQLLSTLEVQRSTGTLGGTPPASGVTASTAPTGGQPPARPNRSSRTPLPGATRTITKGGGAQAAKPTVGLSGTQYPSVGAARRAGDLGTPGPRTAPSAAAQPRYSASPAPYAGYFPYPPPPAYAPPPAFAPPPAYAPPTAARTGAAGAAGASSAAAGAPGAVTGAPANGHVPGWCTQFLQSGTCRHGTSCRFRHQ